PPLPPQQHVDTSISIAALLPGELGDALAQFAAVGAPAPIPVERPRHAKQPAGAHHPKPVLLPEHIRRLALPLRAHHFRPSRSFRAALSNSDSASSLFIFAFSDSSSFSGCASETVVPANVGSEIPY